MTQEAAAPTLREAFIAAFMDGLSWMLANPESKPGEWRQAAVDCAGMRLATRPADPVEPAEPSSRERWNAENPGELSLHTFDDDATPAEPQWSRQEGAYQAFKFARAALQGSRHE